MVIESLESILKETLESLGCDGSLSKVIKSNRPELCDYQFDGVFKLAKENKTNPIEIGNKIVDTLNKRSDFNSYFNEVTFAPPGFVNLTLSDEFINNCLVKMNDKEKFGLKKPDSIETYIIDYGGYNIAKPLHIGHIRPSIIGESIKRIINYKGHKTIADVHLGDYGLQMGQVIYGIIRDKKSIDEIDLAYLNKIYPEISGLCKSDESIKEECAKITKELQEHTNEEYNKYWDQIMKVSLIDVKDLCSYLDVSFDLWQGESDGYKYIKDVENILREKNLLKESEGALVVEVKKDDDNKPMPPLMFQKSNGAYSYAPTDLATIYDRKNKYNPDHIIYVTDFRQNLHFEQIFRCSDMAGLIPYNSLEHACNGTINGSDGKPFKTRSGDAPKLRELFEEVKETFISIREENKNMNEKDLDIIVNAIIKFADLQNSRDKDYIFDIEKFSNVVGKTGPYVLYTYVRINKIIENEKKDFTKLSKCIYNKQDRDLRLQYLNLESAIENAYTSRMPSYIANYVYDTCVLLNAFYQNNHINNQSDEITKNDWLYILSLGNKILKEMLELIIIDIPSVM